jgi:hypothetical protein
MAITYYTGSNNAVTSGNYFKLNFSGSTEGNKKLAVYVHSDAASSRNVASMLIGAASGTLVQKWVTADFRTELWYFDNDDIPTSGLSQVDITFDGVVARGFGSLSGLYNAAQGNITNRSSNTAAGVDQYTVTLPSSTSGNFIASVGIFNGMDGGERFLSGTHTYTFQRLAFPAYMYFGQRGTATGGAQVMRQKYDDKFPFLSHSYDAYAYEITEDDAVAASQPQMIWFG